MHAKAMNSKIDNPSIAPERYHSSKLIAEFEAKSGTGSQTKEKLLPTHPKDSASYMSNPLKASVPRIPDTQVSLKVEKAPAMKQMR